MSAEFNRRQVISRRLLLYAVAIVLAIAFIQPPPMEIPKANAEQPHLKKSKPHPKPASTVKPAEAKTTAQQSMPAVEVTCEQAIRQVWPPHLQDGAFIVLQHENAEKDPEAVGAINPDKAKSRDYGCFQINDHWHPNYFSEGDWKDPVWAAKYALKIYEGRQIQTGNGWEAWYAVEGILW